MASSTPTTSHPVQVLRPESSALAFADSARSSMYLAATWVKVPRAEGRMPVVAVVDVRICRTESASRRWGSASAMSASA